MIKLGTTKGDVLVQMTEPEFVGITGSNPASVPDGTAIPTKRIQKLSDLVKRNSELLSSIRSNVNEFNEVRNG